MPILPKVPLILAPTPLHRLDRVSDELGINLWIKRDDLTGFALGGNKGRKLEFLMAEILDQRADIVVACGAIQSNFIRQLAAACSVHGVRCAAAVMELPFYGAAGKPNSPGVGPLGANAVLDQILGVEVHLTPDDDWEALYAFQESVAQKYEAEGLRVYRMPIGGSSVQGALSFVLAGIEAEAQESGFDFLVTPSSSGSTHSGLAWHFHGRPTRVIGISADPDPEGELVADMVELAEGLDEILQTKKRMAVRDFDLRMEWVGEGYSVPSPAGTAAIEHLARAEGIFLDPVYSGKAFAALLDLTKSREIGGKVLFWHTGGTPVLFAGR